MAKEITMPQLSDTMDSGKILSWSKNEGDTVDRGDILAEVETDKANLEIESFHKGVLLKIVCGVDSTAAVGEVIAYIGEAGEEVPANGAAPAAPAAAETSAPEAPAAAPAPTPEPTPVATPSPPAPIVNTGRIKASPLAKKIAAERGVDLSTIAGSGPEGRIVKKDVEGAGATQQAPASTPSPQQARPAPSTPPRSQEAPGEGAMIPFSKMRSTIARRMQQSVNEAPHFFVTTSVRMDRVMELRKILKTKPGYETTSINHFVIKAVAYGIVAEPRVNYAVRDEQFVYQPPEINVGIITAIEDGLLIPVIRNADQLSLQDIVLEARAAVERARAGRPSPQDLVGGTFSISNMGMFDVESFTAVINPGQGSVLAVSSILDQPIVEDGKVTIGKMMKVTISVDHRIIDGVMAGNFLKAFKESLENPALLALT